VKPGKFVIFFSAALFCMSFSFAEIEVDYEDNRMLLPESNSTILIAVKNTENESRSLNISCESELNVMCPSIFSVRSGETAGVPIKVRTGNLGSYVLNFEIGGSRGYINIRVTNTPVSLLNMLDHYNSSIQNLEKNSVGFQVPKLDEAKTKLENSYKLYEKSMFYKVNEYIFDLQTIIESVSEEVAAKKAEVMVESFRTEAEKESSSGTYATYFVYPLVFFGLVFAGFKSFKYLKRENYNVNVKSDLSKVNKGIGEISWKKIKRSKPIKIRSKTKK